MELRQLHYLAAVVEEANFTRAAARLHLAQPGVSAQIRQLERELGHRLLDRSGRTVTTTEVGEAVLPYVRAALAAVAGIRQTADEYAGLVRGQVAIGLVAGAATEEFAVADLLAGFHRDHPGVEISLTESASEQMLAALRRGELDIAIVGLLDEQPPPGIGLQVVVDTPLVAAAAVGDPVLADDAPLPVTALADRPLISLPRGTGLRAVLERACAHAGIEPRIAFEASSPPLLARLAATGLGLAVLPDLPAEHGAALGIRTRRLADPALRGRIAVAWPADGPATPAAAELLARLRRTFPAVAPG
ncbi:LysR family transcriptional regulator [Kitasatospora sp. NPDC127111]|uniref:LysR family transcriptional regulator n=1 Tax=Kitasatospora sp. NPDC127111 TaxID=3345363 RepID=UPI0036402968